MFCWVIFTKSQHQMAINDNHCCAYNIHLMNIYDNQLAVSGATLHHIGLLMQAEEAAPRINAAEFRDRMGRCHRRTDLMNLFNGNWSLVRGTFDELSALRLEFAARLDVLTEDGSCGVARSEMEAA